MIDDNQPPSSQSPKLTCFDFFRERRKTKSEISRVIFFRSTCAGYKFWDTLENRVLFSFCFHVVVSSAIALCLLDGCGLDQTEIRAPGRFVKTASPATLHRKSP